MKSSAAGEAGGGERFGRCARLPAIQLICYGSLPAVLCAVAIPALSARPPPKPRPSGPLDVLLPEPDITGEVGWP